MLRTLLRWRIYYDDDSVADNESTPDAFDVPALGVIAIVKADLEVGRLVVSECHYYCYRPDERTWYGVGRGDTLSAGLVDYLIQPGPRKVIFGRTISNAKFDAIMKRALNDVDFPAKSASHSVEGF